MPTLIIHKNSADIVDLWYSPIFVTPASIFLMNCFMFSSKIDSVNSQVNVSVTRLFETAVSCVVIAMSQCKQSQRGGPSLQ